MPYGFNNDKSKAETSNLIKVFEVSQTVSLPANTKTRVTIPINNAPTGYKYAGILGVEYGAVGSSIEGLNYLVLCNFYPAGEIISQNESRLVANVWLRNTTNVVASDINVKALVLFVKSDFIDGGLSNE